MTRQLEEALAKNAQKFPKWVETRETEGFHVIINTGKKKESALYTYKKETLQKILAFRRKFSAKTIYIEKKWKKIKTTVSAQSLFEESVKSWNFQGLWYENDDIISYILVWLKVAKQTIGEKDDVEKNISKLTIFPATIKEKVITHSDEMEIKADSIKSSLLTLLEWRTLDTEYEDKMFQIAMELAKKWVTPRYLKNTIESEFKSDADKEAFLLYINTLVEKPIDIIYKELSKKDITQLLQQWENYKPHLYYKREDKKYSRISILWQDEHDKWRKQRNLVGTHIHLPRLNGHPDWPLYDIANLHGHQLTDELLEDNIAQVEESLSIVRELEKEWEDIFSTSFLEKWANRAHQLFLKRKFKITDYSIQWLEEFGTKEWVKYIMKKIFKENKQKTSEEVNSLIDKIDRLDHNNILWMIHKYKIREAVDKYRKEKLLFVYNDLDEEEKYKNRETILRGVQTKISFEDEIELQWVEVLDEEAIEMLFVDFIDSWIPWEVISFATDLKTVQRDILLVKPEEKDEIDFLVPNENNDTLPLGVVWIYKNKSGTPQFFWAKEALSWEAMPTNKIKKPKWKVFWLSPKDFRTVISSKVELFENMVS